MKIFFVIISFLFILSACGPSEQEVKTKLLNEQQNQRITDSIQQAQQAYKEQLEQYLIELKAELEGEQSTMEKIKEFHFGRLQSEKEEQIKQQSIKIQTLEKNIKDTEKQLESYQ
jgi:hypothetical protein